MRENRKSRQSRPGGPSIPQETVEPEATAVIAPRQARGPGLLHLYTILEDVIQALLELDHKLADQVGVDDWQGHQRLVDLLDETRPITKALRRVHPGAE